jgi:uncharacterized protein YkuJ
MRHDSAVAPKEAAGAPEAEINSDHELESEVVCLVVSYSHDDDGFEVTRKIISKVREFQPLAP